MRHRVQKRKFNRDTKHRQALLKNLVTALVTHGTVVTTVPKAKETSRIADKLIGKARTNSLTTRRTLHQFFGKRDVVNTLVDSIAPVFTDRASGFTRVIKMGPRRGDNSEMARVSLVQQPETTGSLRKPVVAEEAAAPAAKAVSKKTAAKAEQPEKKPVAKKASAKKAPAKKAAPKKAAAKVEKKA
jgi:large subunit ribosomal protein L17